MARGVDSITAASISDGGHSIAALRAKSLPELLSLGLPENIAKDIYSKRTPIPAKTLLKLLHDNKWVCCVCRSESAPVVIHHIEPWAKSRSHEADNLVVLCPSDHAKAHSKGALSQNLSPEALRDAKRRWEEQVHIDDALVIRRAAQTVGEYWFFFNLLRLHEIASHEGIDWTSLPHYSESRRAGILDECGHLVPETTDSNYAYSGRFGSLRYAYAKDLFLTVLDRLSIADLSGFSKRGHVVASPIKNDIIYVEGAFNFKRLSRTELGPNQRVQASRLKKGVRVTFSFDRWYATSTSANSVWLTGRKVVGCFCRVGDVSRENGEIVYTCTVLAISEELSSLRDLSYLDAFTPALQTPQDQRDTERPPIDRDALIKALESQLWHFK
ncbi:HNH endonuclease signature motif containing protein [Caballeronia pedi]